MPGFLLRRRVICFNPGPHVIWCFANGTTLTHFSFRECFQVQYQLSEFFTEISLQMVTAQGVLWKIFKKAVRAKAPISLMLHIYIYQLPKALNDSQNNFCNIVLGFHCLHLDCVLFWRSK